MTAAPSAGRNRLDRPDRLDRLEDMVKAAALLAGIHAAGATLLMEGNKLKVRASVRLPSAVKAELDVHWRSVAILFSGEHCRHCGHPINWRHDGIAFADSTGAHISCYEHAERARPVANAGAGALP
jgi:hypothetical protein